VVYLAISNSHCFLVDAFEEDDSEERSQVAENQEHPDVLSIIDIALEKDGKEQAHGDCRVEW